MRGIGLFAGMALATSTAWAQDVTVTMTATAETGTGSEIGTIAAQDTPGGLRLTPNLKGLPPGQHGIHVHESASCTAREQEGKMVPGLAAGGHYDPARTGKHLGPQGEGHLGDLPALEVGADGSASAPMTAKRLKLADLKGRAIVIHGGGDNYADTPKPLGGGGPRISCGVAP